MTGSLDEFEDRVRRALDQAARSLPVRPAAWQGPSPVTPRRLPQLGLRSIAMLVAVAVPVAIAVLALVLLGHRQSDHGTPSGHPRPSVLQPHKRILGGACSPGVRTGVLPRWARASFSDPRGRMSYALGAANDIIAIPFVALSSPPATDHNNKILWVSRVTVHGGSDLRITAQRMIGAHRVGAPVKRRVIGGPGPSIINVPAPGCWHFSLRWSGHHDSVDLHYGSPRASHQPVSSAAASIKTLPCNESIGTQPPERDMRTVLGVVALPASPGLPRALQTTRSGLRDPAARLFAKWGLTIRPGARFRLIVPSRLRKRLSISWGNAGEGHRGTTIVVNGCPGPPGAKWLSYAGGYFVRDPICATLIVAADRQRRRIQIGIGTPCPGQRPPPQPTER